jgi:hypothetical protein
MCILKALDQGEVDIRKNKELKSQIYKSAKKDAISKKIALRSNLLTNEIVTAKSPKRYSHLQPPIGHAIEYGSI